MNRHDTYCYHWEVYDSTHAFFGFYDKLSHDKKMRLYSEEARKYLTFYQGINSLINWSHGYKGPYPSSKNELHYYVFALYELDTTIVIDITNTGMGTLLRLMESVNIYEGM